MCKKPNNPVIVCVIVTYNRKSLLKRCLDAVSFQTLKPRVVYIIDNASTDGTIDSVKEWGYYKKEKDGVEYKYILNQKNEGGAGGFYIGMKEAFEKEIFDAIWVMDDDGQPEKNCLEELTNHLDSYDYIAPVVLSDEDHMSCSFTLYHESVDEFARNNKANNGIIQNFASPFNGILYSNRLIKKIGFPNKDMFIWGDESNYHIRCINAGFIPITLIKAVHYHPLNRVEYVVSAGRAIAISDVDWKLYCCIRNCIYNDMYYSLWFPKNIYSVFRLLISYLSYYPKKKSLIYDAVISGIRKDFSGLKKYMG